MDLHTPLEDAGRVFKMYQSRLAKLEIATLGDFLYHMPARYENLSLISKIGHIQAGETVTIQGEIVEIENSFTKRWKKVQKASVGDETGEIDITWFNQPFIPKVLHKGDRVSLAGKVDFFGHNLSMQSPEYEVIYPNTPTLHTGRLVPVYPETAGVSSKWLRRQIYKILQDQKQNILEYIPDSVINDCSLMDLNSAIEKVHFPTTFEEAVIARRRLAFNELFITHLASMERKKTWEENMKSAPFKVDPYKKQLEDFWNSLPFTLTNAQNKAVHDILQDVTLEKPMNRLLEGDVGSGKTVVAAITMYLSHLNGFQSVLMAPTEILAGQHYATISKLLEPLGVKVDLVTGSKKTTKEKRSDILVGTHALLSKSVEFEKLGFVVIDEQQRFGVAQRSIMRQKGQNPHLLTMTATPIPRTIALTLYGDLDLSFLDEMPVGRKSVKTWLVPEEKRDPGYKWIESEIQKNGSQAFIICPFIEESESMQTVKAASKEFERLKKEVFPNLKLGLLHGRMKGKEKDDALEAFRRKEFDILVATPVVEVGIDIPNATVIVIEASERFGLSQLHQLRGRVGRSDMQSYCLLFTEARNPKTIERLKAMETMRSGAELAELDLSLRGAGDLYGTMQHGTKQFKIANFWDHPLIQQTKEEAKKIFPDLKKYPELKKKVEELNIQFVSPD
jgi:ATP-dependent DNA helicase RecG